MQPSHWLVDAALDDIIESEACVQANQRLLSETRYRVAASRRQLNQAFALAGGSHDNPLHALVRARLKAGMLAPLNGHKTWAGYGSGKPCVVCGAKIGGAEVEYETAPEDGAQIAHLNCYMAWLAESEPA